jgi:hypothetical protein
MNLASTDQLLREPTSAERIFAIRQSGQPAASYVWVSELPHGGRVFIVFQDFGITGIAFAVNHAEQEGWRKPAFYSEALRSGDGYEARHTNRVINVRSDIDGSWIPSVNGELVPCDTPIFDQRVAMQAAQEFAGVPSSMVLSWAKTQD